MATAVNSKTQEPLIEEQLAANLAGSLIYKALIEAHEPLKASDVVKAVNRPDVDLKLARVILTTSPLMTATDRRWTLWTRFLDTRSSIDFNCHRILNAFGEPMSLDCLAHELNAVYGRPSEIYEVVVESFVEQASSLTRISNNFVLPRNWLLDTEPEAEDEVLFENFLDDADVVPYMPKAKKANLSASNPESIANFLNAAGAAIKIKALQYLAWHLDKENFDSLTFIDALVHKSGAHSVFGGMWIGPAQIITLEAKFPILAQQEVSDNAEAEAQEAAQPLVIGDNERELLVSAVLSSDHTVHATSLLEDIFDVTTDYRTFDEDLSAVIRVLAEDDRVAWVGTDRFQPLGLIPGYVFSVPGLLEIPTFNFLDVDGNPLDQLLETDGFDGGLERDITNPLAQDVLDEEPVPTPDLNPPSNARAVIKYHHKQIGTLPLSLFPSGFFPPEPAIMEAEFLLPGGQRAQVWVNNDTRLLYGLLDWFQSIPIDSGATFTLERQSPDRYFVNYNDESEPTMFISRNRINELIELQERAENDSLGTFDIMREIMEHYRKGIEFLTLHTEVNIVRRVGRSMVASILSEYHCFFQRGGAWVYDTKKLTLGFDKSKKKYLAK